MKPVLHQMQEDLRLKVEHLKDTLALDGTGYTNHQADDATQAFDQAKPSLALRTSSQKQLRLVDDALAKFAAGTYGVCENCGREIDLARLEAYLLHAAMPGLRRGAGISPSLARSA